MKHSIDELKAKTFYYRKRFLELFTAIGFGHVTSAYSWAEIASVLYNEIMYIPEDIEHTEKYDRMVISKGHGVGILFPIFEDLGYFTKEQMNDMIRIGGSNTDLKKLFYPGFDFYGGSLGIGLGVAAGIAKADKLSGNSLRTYCVVGDAECYEGSIWEAVNFAGCNKLNNLTVIIDRNGLGCSDFTEHMLAMEPFNEKWKSFNWEVTDVDGHDIQQLYNCFINIVNSKEEKPHCIIANTKKGQGIEYLIDKPLMHGYMPKGDEIDRAFSSLEQYYENR